jgi:hypothetical protein
VKVGGLPPGEDQAEAEQHLDYDGRLGYPERVPEAQRRLAPQPSSAAPDPGDEVGREQSDSGDDMDLGQGGASLRVKPLERVGFPLPDAENHYVTG